MSAKVERRIGADVVTYSNPDKVLFPVDGITKSELIEYYEEVAEVMVRHVAGRPLMLERYPDGIEKKPFYQKNASKHFPDWIERVQVEKSGGSVEHPLADDAAALAYLAGQATITFHVWSSRLEHLPTPDRLIFDLDPSVDDFETVRHAAHSVQALLEEIGLAVYIQTSGSRGLHVVAPLDQSADMGTVRAFAEDAASLLVAREPDLLTTEFRKQERGDRLFVDVMRNGYAQTTVASYSVRSRDGAPVATPIELDELDDPELHAGRWTLRTVLDRLADRPDPWADINRHARSLRGPRERLDALRQ